MKLTKYIRLRVISLTLVAIFALSALAGCSGVSEIPEGFQYATCNGEYFRLFVPTQWTVNTVSGVSGAYVSQNTGNTVTMREVSFTPLEAQSGEDKKPFDYFVEAHRADIETLRDFEKVSEANTTMSGYRAWEIVYTAKVSEKTHKFRQVLSKANDRYFIFTYSALENYYDAVVEDVDEILAEILFYNTPYNGGEHKKIPTDVDIPEGMKLVSDDTVAFRFFAPDDWTVDEKNESCVVYFSESDRSNVSILPYMPADDQTTVEQYWKDTELYYKNNLVSYKLISTNTKATLGGQDAVEYVYTYSVGGVNYKAMQTVTVYSTMIYSMTYTAVAENYDAHLDDVALMGEKLTFRHP
ncbi:MAG: hypothetical protein IJX74_00205 [Clostridia bacterium]|nr:hypothetical protein [Clostridia bacterium]